MGGWDKHIVPMLNHACCQTWCEDLCRRVEVAQHDVAAPPSHKPYCVRVESGDQEHHGSSSSHGSCTNVFRLETDLWARYLHWIYECLGDIGDSDGRPLVFVVYCCQRRVATGAILSKVWHTAPDGCYCKRPGMARLYMSNWPPFESIILIGEKEADEVCGGASKRVICSVWGWVYSDVELYVLEAEGGGDWVGASLEIFSWLQWEEKRDPGQVWDCLLSWGPSLCGFIDKVQDCNGDGSY